MVVTGGKYYSMCMDLRGDTGARQSLTKSGTLYVQQKPLQSDEPELEMPFIGDIMGIRGKVSESVCPSPS